MCSGRSPEIGLSSTFQVLPLLVYGRARLSGWSAHMNEWQVPRNAAGAVDVCFWVFDA